MWWIATAVFIYIILKFTNILSYSIIKNNIIKSRKWDLNICCGKTDAGGINADIIQHTDVDNFQLVKDIYSLPYSDDQFDYVISSHTLEHVDDPEKFYSELDRVSKNLTILLPPLWDLSAAFNFLEHRWVFLTLRTKHTVMPKFVRVPLSGWYHKKFGQKIKA